MKDQLAKWGFSTPRGNDGGRLHEVEPPAPRDAHRDLAQVKELLATGVTAQMLLEHPYIRLTVDARAFLEGLTERPEHV